MSVERIGIGMLGYGFMGRAHAGAYRTLRHLPAPSPLVPSLVSVCGRTRSAVAAAAEEFGFAGSTTDWREVVADARVAVFDNTGPNSLHHAPTIAAARQGKHLICEKPLGLNADESFEMWAAASNAGVQHMCAFNYRFVPAVRLAREMLEAGELGEIYHFRGRYLQDWVLDPDLRRGWRLNRSMAGSGALGDLGAHVIDLARYLVGEPATVAATMAAFVTGRPDAGDLDEAVDDAVEAAVEFESGAIGTIEASRVCAGRKNALTFEISGSKGSIAFDLERLNELQVNLSGSTNPNLEGFRTVLVTQPQHPYLSNWWPPGHVLGWEHTFTHELAHFLNAIARDESVAPHGATFADGYRAAEVCDAIGRSARFGRREAVSYRALTSESVRTGI